MLKAPCKNCNYRYSACHDHYDKYKAYKTESKRVNDMVAKEKQTLYDYYEVRHYHVRKETRK